MNNTIDLTTDEKRNRNKKRSRSKDGNSTKPRDDPKREAPRRRSRASRRRQAFRKSPISLNRRSPISLNRRSPISLNRRSPISLNRRSPISFNRRSPILLNRRSRSNSRDNKERLKRRFRGRICLSPKNRQEERRNDGTQEPFFTFNQPHEDYGQITLASEMNERFAVFEPPNQIPDEPSWDNHQSWDAAPLEKYDPIEQDQDYREEPNPAQIWQEEWQSRNKNSGGFGGTGTFISAEEGHPEIPIFDGENPDLTARQWLKIIDRIALKENWSNDHKKFQMAAKLVGAPKEWYLKDDKLTEPWNRIKQTFPKAFMADMDYFTSLHNMIERKKQERETYSNYFTFKTILLNACNITGRKAVSCLIGGLNNPNLQQECLDLNLATPELLYNFLMAQQEVNRKPLLSNERNDFPAESSKQLIKPQSFSTPSFVDKSFSFDPKYCLDVIINGHTLKSYNDFNCQCMTIREYEATTIKLFYNRTKSVIIGFKGSSITTLGEMNVLIRVGTVVVNMQIFIVPNAAQEFPVILGDSLRNHQDVEFHEDMDSISFIHRGFQPSKISSFSMNEMKFSQKMNKIGQKEFRQPMNFKMENMHNRGNSSNSRMPFY